MAASSISNRLILTLLLVGCVTAAGLTRKRRADNSYGDEAVTPAGGGARVASMAVEVIFWNFKC